MMGEHIVAVDVGSTRCRAVAYQPTGVSKASAESSMPLPTGKGGAAELETKRLWEVVVETLCALPARVRQETACLAVTGQTRSQIVLDGQNRPLFPAILWPDTRAQAVAQEIQKQVTPQQIQAYLGYSYPLGSSAWPARILWLFRDRPFAMDKAAKVMQLKDYVNFRLTGDIATDTSSCLGFLRWPDKVISDQFLKQLGIDREIIPVIRQPHERIGELQRGPSNLLGMPAGTPVVACAMDSWCDFLGSGLGAAGEAVDIGGTTEVVGLFDHKFTAVSDLVVMPYIDSLVFAGGPLQNGGSCYRWLEDVFGPTEELSRPRQRTGLVFLPFLQGERTPYWQADLRGALLGLDQHHRQEEITWAVMAGVAASIRDVISRAEQAATKTRSLLRVTGGASRNAAWNQIKADMLGCPVVTTAVTDTACLGAAMLGALHLEWFDSWQTIRKGWVHAKECYAPTEQSSWYEDYYALYGKSVAFMMEIRSNLARLRQ